MLYKFRRTFLLACKLLCFLVNLGIFIFLFSVENAYLLRPSRTAAITLLAFAFVYGLTTQVYGGFDIDKKKSKPVIYSLALCLVAADLVAHLFLCIMNITVVNNGVFVYEQPWLLLFVMLLQLFATTLLTYGANFLYFQFVPPKKSMVIHNKSCNAKKLISSISSFRKQYSIDCVTTPFDPELLSLIDRHDCIFLCDLTVTERLHIEEYCYAKGKHIYYTLEMADFVSLGASRTMFGDTSVMHYPPKGLTIEQRIVKRTVDIVFSALMLLVLSPLFALTALAIKAEDGGKVFYKQKRATYGGKIFYVIKFRSMKENNAVNAPVTKDDTRITRVGKFIRKYRIDELPQLINVLKNEMSLVGPRPEMLENVEKYTSELPEFSYRLRVKAGITGMAQIYGKYNTSPKEKLALDLAYIEQYSLPLDLRLLLRTALAFFRPEESTEAFDTDTSEETTP